MSLQQLKAVKKIKEIRRYHCQYRYRIYQASLRDIEAELVFNKEKKLNEVKIRKEYENNAYGELENKGATISRLGQIRNEVKGMLVHEKATEKHLQGITETYNLNKQALQKIKNELLVMEKKLEGLNEMNEVTMKTAAKTNDYKAQDDNDDFAIVNYIKKI